jgi:hypothetical protein
MSQAADAIRNLITPLLSGWRVQFGRWVDGLPTDRFSVIRPAPGGPATLVRRPQFSVMLIGAVNDPATIPDSKANEIIEAMRASNGGLVVMTASEPFFFPTSDGRPVFEIAVSTITN